VQVIPAVGSPFLVAGSQQNFWVTLARATPAVEPEGRLQQDEAAKE
jgi:hypothetical protein